ncbi:MAG: hypothetical protein K9W43_02355 [Candidatus Thorarchaeota archaeon]|nr:hypothetical protein [Candidatus Thorarchaeota archaeon]
MSRMQSDLFGNIPEIVIDVHELKGKRQNSVKHLMAMLDKESIKYVVEQIPIGDILGPEGVAIERKTVSDLVNTLKGSSTGAPRLTRQIEGLLVYERPYLLIENILSIRRDPVKGCIYVPFKTTQTKGRPYVVTMETVNYIHPSSLDALIESIREQGIEVIEGYNALHSAGLLFNVLFPRDEKSHPKGKRLPVIRTRKSRDNFSEEQEFFIAGITGINVVRARSLLKKFGGPIEVITRTDEWTEIPGIGPKTVSTARKMLYSKYVAPETEESD